jgi:hypothetical protein
MSGNYYDSNQSKCLSCHFSCKECTGAANNECSSCESSLISNRNDFSTNPLKLSCPCFVGYTDNSINKICEKCHYSCLTCSGSGPNKCDSCINDSRDDLSATGTCPCSKGFYQFKRELICRACHYSCKACLGPSAEQCTEC